VDVLLQSLNFVVVRTDIMIVSLLLIYLLTAVGLTPGGSSTVQYSTHLHTNSTQNSTMKQNTQNITCITIKIHNVTVRIHKHKSRNT
jgi:hypothetical protein